MAKKSVIDRFLEYQSSHFDSSVDNTIRMFKQNMSIEFESVPDYSVSNAIKHL